MIILRLYLLVGEGVVGDEFGQQSERPNQPAANGQQSQLFTFHEIPTSTRSDTPRRQPSLILFSLDLAQAHPLQGNSCLTTLNSESAIMQRAKRSSSRHSNRSAYLLSRRGGRGTVSSLAQTVRLHCACTKPRRSQRSFTWRSRPRIASKSKLSIARLWRGGKDNGAPGLCENHANYYAAFVIGPDGHNIEVVCHELEA